MNWLKKTATLIWRGWFVLLVSLTVLFIGTFLIIPFTFKRSHFKYAYFFLRVWAFIVFFGIGLRYKKMNFKRFDEAHPYIIISNHTSLMDIMLMYILNPKPMVFVGKSELKKLPVFGYIFNKLNIAVDRKDPNSRMKVFRAAAACLNERKSVCIFPEGGVPELDVFMKEFLDGPFAVAVMNKVPLVSLTFCGMKKCMPYAYFEGGPGLIEITLNEIFETAEMKKSDIKELKKTAEEQILTSLKACAEKGKHF